MQRLQEMIHRLEVGGGIRWVQIGLGVLAVLVVGVLYDGRAFKNMGTQEAMDTAQLARNLAAGDGYTTLFIRPLSIHLLQQHCEPSSAGLTVGTSATARLNGMHPDLANAPVYPVLLAGLMRTLDTTRLFAFHYPISSKPQPFWSRGGHFWRYQPDFLIAVFNQLLFLVLVVMVYFLARRLFDASVAWLTALLVFGTDLLWRFSVSGLSTILLMILFVGLVWCLCRLDEEVREPKRGVWGAFVLAAVAGILVGFGGLTRYAFAWMILPVLLFVVLFMGRQRLVLGLTALLAFAAVLSPWVVRNYRLSGTPFGTATYTLLESTALFPEYKLQRSLEPDLSQVNVLSAFWQKLSGNAHRILEDDLPKLGGNWVSAFFLTGLLVGFRNPSVRRLRYFLVGSLVVFAIAQSLGRTQLSEDSPDLNTENLLVLATPLVLMYGVSLFYLLLDQVAVPFREMRYIAIAIFATFACLPLILTLLKRPLVPINFPPYYPPAIQTSVGYIKGVSAGKDGKGQTDAGELMTSDIPWAVAWYGYSQCAWLPANLADFFTINDLQKPIQAMYLTPQTMDKLNQAGEWKGVATQAELKLLGQTANTLSWPLYISFGARRSVLPLHWMQPEDWPHFLLLTSRQHWAKDS